MQTWAEIHYHEPLNSEDACQQILWFNSAIKIGNKFLKNNLMEQKGLVFIKDLLDNHGKIANRTYIQEKYNTEISIMYYNSMVSAIPKKWKKLIEEDNNSTNYFRMQKCQIMIESRPKRLEELKCRDLYWLFINKINCRPSSESKWEEKVGLNFDEDMWAKLYQNPYGLTSEAYILALHFEITHRTLACGYNLNIWKIKESNICETCQNDTDTIEHHMVACEPTLRFWNTVFNWWKAAIGFMFPIDTYDILFGLPNETEDIQVKQLNFILLLGCSYVYTNKQQKKDSNLYEFLIYCKNKLEAKRETLCIQNRESKFVKHWDTLYNAI